MKKALMMASVASMIDLFNMNNINILRDMGFEIHVACNFEYGSITSQERVDEFRKELEKRGIKTFNIPVPRNISSVKDIITSYKSMKLLCKENNYNIVHCHSPIGGVVARLACKKFRKKGTKVIYTAHGFHFFKGAPIKNWLLFYPIERICAKYTDCLITINKEDYQLAKTFKCRKVQYVPGIGIDTKDIKNTKVDRELKRLEFGFKNKDFVLISVGQLSKRKNHEVIIRALANIPEDNVKYLICGFGELEEHLKRITDELNLSERVIFAGYRSDIKELLHSSDCFLFPSLQEGLPVALMEAMASGLPIICSDIRGNSELINDNYGGFLFKLKDNEKLIEKIYELFKDDELCEKMGKYNLIRVNEFDILNVNNTMKNIYGGV